MDASKVTESDVSRMYDLYGNMLYRICCSSVSGKEDAEDAVQNVFIKYMKKSPAFADEEHEKAWFIRVALNECHDIMRHHKRHNHDSIDDHENIPSELKEDDRDVYEAVLELPEKYRQVFLLYYFESFSISEVAVILKISESAVKMRLSRGKEILKKKITERREES